MFSLRIKLIMRLCCQSRRRSWCRIDVLVSGLDAKRSSNVPSPHFRTPSTTGRRFL